MPLATRARLTTAILVSVLLVLAAPFVGRVQHWLRGALGSGYVPVVNGVVAVATTAALVAVASQIRDRRLWRYAVVLAAVAIAALYAWRSGLASAESNAVERFHFVEYGVITWLFYRVRSIRLTWAGTITPVVCALAVGAADEWLQHLAPARIGELRDIFMNMAAIVSGLLVSVAIAPPAARPARPATGEMREFAAAAAIAVALVASFTVEVHVGSWIADDEVAFRSRYTADELTYRAGDNASASPTLRWGIENQYVTEAIWHVQARNLRWGAGDVAAAWGENRILEKYFTSVLASGYAWPAEQRADAARRVASAPRRQHRSHAERIPIWVF